MWCEGICSGFKKVGPGKKRKMQVGEKEQIMTERREMNRRKSF